MFMYCIDEDHWQNDYPDEFEFDEEDNWQGNEHYLGEEVDVVVRVCI